MNFSRSYHSFPTLPPATIQRESSQLKLTILLSFALHIIFLWLLAAQRTPIVPEIIEIELIASPELRQQSRKQQLVSPPEQNRDPAEKPNFLSEVDSRAPTEQIKRGDSPEAGIPNPRSQQQPQEQSAPQKPLPAKPQQVQAKEKPIERKLKPVEKPEQEEKKSPGEQSIKEAIEPKSIKQLSLDAKSLSEKYPLKEPVSETAQNTQRQLDPSQYRAFSRPPGSGARFIGKQGSNDYLPNLPDGDITLLNTKADQFAVFVRRVATQVFGELRNTGWEVLNSNDIHSAVRFSSYRAVLSLKGKLLRVEQISDSGSQRFDRTLEAAVTQGARDQNPPAAAAASDGTIRFIFQAKSWSQVVGSPRSGAPIERRWLLLSTGLE